jgi:hypothetical protein
LFSDSDKHALKYAWISMVICDVLQGKDDPSNWDITELKQNLQARFISRTAEVFLLME